MDEELRELFCLKIGLENASFKKRMLKQSAEVLFERAYQIDTMLNLYELSGGNEPKDGTGSVKNPSCVSESFGFSL